MCARTRNPGNLGLTSAHRATVAAVGSLDLGWGNGTGETDKENGVGDVCEVSVYSHNTRFELIFHQVHEITEDPCVLPVRRFYQSDSMRDRSRPFY